MILYRANRLRFAVATALIAPVAILFLVLAFSDFASGDGDQGLLMAGLDLFFLWLGYIFVANSIWPPELEISFRGVRLFKRGLFVSGSYAWEDLDGPVEVRGGYGVPLLQMIVRATGKKLRVPPSHFGATYEEMAAVIEGAQEGRLIDRARWRAEHPPHPLRDWLLDWGLPILLAVIVICIRRYLKA